MARRNIQPGQSWLVSINGFAPEVVRVTESHVIAIDNSVAWAHDELAGWIKYIRRV